MSLTGSFLGTVLGVAWFASLGLQSVLLMPSGQPYSPRPASPLECDCSIELRELLDAKDALQWWQWLAAWLAALALAAVLALLLSLWCTCQVLTCCCRHSRPSVRKEQTTLLALPSADLDSETTIVYTPSRRPPER